MGQTLADWQDFVLTHISTHMMEICMLRRIERILLSSNKLLSFNRELLDSMHHVKLLNLSRNLLSSIPQQLFELPVLENLNLSENKIKKLPNNIKWCRSLIQLNLRGNQLKMLPYSISNSSIQILNLNDNQFEIFPAAICKLGRQLQQLWFDNNKRLSMFPNDILNVRTALQPMVQMEQVSYILISLK